MKAILDKFFDETLLSHEEKEPQRFEFRGSSLPICPTYLMLGKFHTLEKTLDFKTKYHFAIGHAIHDLVQATWAKQGLLWGDWQCLAEDCKANFKRKRLTSCLRCGGPLKYVEMFFDIKEFGISGHCDGLLWVEKLNGYVVVELKSRNFNIIKSYQGSEPYDSDIYQVSTYATMLSRKYWLPILGRYIIWIGKPRPKPFLTWFYPGLGADLFDEQVKLNNEMEQKVKEGKVREVQGVCETYSDSGGCTFAPVCFSPNKNELIEAAYQEWKCLKT